MAYIRAYYLVPAKRGARVAWPGGDGKRQTGTVIGSRGQYIRVRLDGERTVITLHPLWEVDWL